MATLVDPRLVRLLAYWAGKRGGRPAPGRADIDPLDIPDLLPILNLLDVLREPMRFRHRLVGTEIVKTLGRDATGQIIGEELYGPVARDMHESLARLVAEARPFRRHARLSWNGQEWLVLEALELPLIGADGRVDMILRGTCFSRSSEPHDTLRRYEPVAIDGTTGTDTL